MCTINGMTFRAPPCIIEEHSKMKRDLLMLMALARNGGLHSKNGKKELHLQLQCCNFMLIPIFCSTYTIHNAKQIFSSPVAIITIIIFINFGANKSDNNLTMLNLSLLQSRLPSLDALFLISVFNNKISWFPQSQYRQSR